MKKYYSLTFFTQGPVLVVVFNIILSCSFSLDLNFYFRGKISEWNNKSTDFNRDSVDAAEGYGNDLPAFQD